MTGDNMNTVEPSNDIEREHDVVVCKSCGKSVSLESLELHHRVCGGLPTADTREDIDAANALLAEIGAITGHGRAPTKGELRQAATNALRKQVAQITHLREEIERLRELLRISPDPIDMVLFCPNCGEQHVDEPDERTPDWTNPPHRSHLCHSCGCIWRPADVPTNGVAAVETQGKADTWAAKNTVAAKSISPAMKDDLIEAVAFAIAPHLQRVTPINPDCEDVNAGRDYARLVARHALEAASRLEQAREPSADK